LHLVHQADMAADDRLGRCVAVSGVGRRPNQREPGRQDQDAAARMIGFLCLVSTRLVVERDPSASTLSSAAPAAALAPRPFAKAWPHLHLLRRAGAGELEQQHFVSGLFDTPRAFNHFCGIVDRADRLVRMDSGGSEDGMQHRP
jgi:hypothetical protein